MVKTLLNKVNVAFDKAVYCVSYTTGAAVGAGIVVCDTKPVKAVKDFCEDKAATAKAGFSDGKGKVLHHFSSSDEDVEVCYGDVVDC